MTEKNRDTLSCSVMTRLQEPQNLIADLPGIRDCSLVFQEIALLVPDTRNRSEGGKLVGVEESLDGLDGPVHPLGGVNRDNNPFPARKVPVVIERV
jgi:hypothetical protein